MDKYRPNPVISTKMRHKQYTLWGVMSLSLIATSLSLLANHSCQTQDIKILESEFEVSITLYNKGLQKKDLIEKLLILFPPTGGANVIDRSYANLFCKNGYFVVTINDWTGSQDKEPDFSLHQRVHQSAQKALETVLKKFPAQYVGLLGTSLGGVFASTAAHNLKKIDSIFTITAGTPISDVIVHSKQKDLEKLKKFRAQSLGITLPEDQIQSIRKVFFLEPMDLPPEHQNKCLGMVIASKDTVVPAAYQYKLKNFWQPQKVIELNFDHFWGIINTWLFYSDEILNFFENSYEKRGLKGELTKC